MPAANMTLGPASVLPPAPVPLRGTGGASATLAARGSDIGVPNIEPDKAAGGRQGASGGNEKAAGGPLADDAYT